MKLEQVIGAKVAIYCPTEKEGMNVLEIMKELGIDPRLDFEKIPRFLDCIVVKDNREVEYTCHSPCERKNYTIIAAAQFIADNTPQPLSYKLEDIFNKSFAIHCPTEEKAISVLAILNEAPMHIRWETRGDEYSIDLYRMKGKNSCYCPTTSKDIFVMNSLSYYKDLGYTIIPASDFIPANYVPNTTGAPHVYDFDNSALFTAPLSIFTNRQVPVNTEYID